MKVYSLKPKEAIIGHEAIRIKFSRKYDSHTSIVNHYYVLLKLEHARLKMLMAGPGTFWPSTSRWLAAMELEHVVPSSVQFAAITNYDIHWGGGGGGEFWNTIHSGTCRIDSETPFCCSGSYLLINLDRSNV